MTKISVVIPSYNHRHYIEKAVDSVLNQSEHDLELIVIDDGSTDDSLSYLRQISDSRFKLVEQKNAGAHNAINRGLALAQGEYLAILNSDDIFHPDRLKRCIEALLRENADLVTTWIEVINADGKPLGVKEAWKNMLPWSIPDMEKSFSATDDFSLNLIVSNFVSTTSNIVFTRKLYEKVGGMRNLRFAHDWDFMFRAAETSKCVLLPEALMQYRIHGSNTISSNRAWMLFEICWVMATGMRRFERDLFYKGSSVESWLVDVHRLHNSVNLQGNDKVYWMIQQFISSQEAKGVMEPELLLLDSAELRAGFIEYIVIEQPLAEPVSVAGVQRMSLFSLLKMWLRQYIKA
ncbi:glycosyltransferase [Pseudomonas sp. B21-051]|uniref:glycosyltransferase n=1 Tax=Pseudomonas sp. B21-051 TaxID=2895491 RepID=UPI00215F65C8|nr:glycosyltransferase [Pseudomonas sp. B21-051]UVK86905.1 glycosyltransferase [Pseudomonas sp. B21-051]